MYNKLMSKILMNNAKYLRPNEASKILGVTRRTLQLWDAEGKIKTYITTGGHRRYLADDIKSILREGREPPRRKIIYARVSSRSKKEDLQSRIRHIQGKFEDYELISDLKFKRKGLDTILELAHKDFF